MKPVAIVFAGLALATTTYAADGVTSQTQNFMHVMKNGLRISLSRPQLVDELARPCIEKQLKALDEVFKPETLARLLKQDIAAIEITVLNSNSIDRDLKGAEISRGIGIASFELRDVMPSGEDLILNPVLTSSWFDIDATRGCRIASAADILKYLAAREKADADAAASEKEAQRVFGLASKSLDKLASAAHQGTTGPLPPQGASSVEIHEQAPKQLGGQAPQAPGKKRDYLMNLMPAD